MRWTYGLWLLSSASCLQGAEILDPPAQAPPQEIVQGARIWTADATDGLVELADETGRRWQPIPPWVRGRVQVLADPSGVPAYLVAAGRGRFDQPPETIPSLLIGLGGVQPPLGSAIPAMIEAWREQGLGATISLSGRIVLAEEELPLSVQIPPEGPLSLSLPPGLTGRVWADGSRGSHAPLMAVLTGAGGSLFLQGTLSPEGVAFQPLGAWFRTGKELQEALDTGCAHEVGLSLKIAPEGRAPVTLLAHLAPRPSPGEVWVGPDGGEVDLWVDRQRGECYPISAELDLSFDAPGLCGPQGGSTAQALWSRAEGGIAGLCHGAYQGSGVTPLHEVHSKHDALRQRGRPCRLERGEWVVGECQPLQQSPPDPGPGPFAAQAGRWARSGEVHIPHEIVPPYALQRLVDSPNLDVLLDQHGQPGWVALPVGEGSWSWLVTLGDHAPPPMPLRAASQRDQLAAPSQLRGKVQLLQEALPVSITLGQDAKVELEGLPEGVTAHVTVDPALLRGLGEGIYVWLVGPTGSVLLGGALTELAEDGSLGLVLAPVPGVLLDRAALQAVLVEGACFDGVLEEDGQDWDRRGPGAYSASHPQRAPDPEELPIRRPDHKEWVPSASPEVLLALDPARPMAGSRLGTLRELARGGRSGSLGSGAVRRVHSCGEPPLHPGDPAAPRREVQILSDPDGLQVWVDNLEPVRTPATVSLQVGLNHVIHAVYDDGSTTRHLRLTESGPTEVCLARDGDCDGVTR
jgi:hypothetical protein